MGIRGCNLQGRKDTLSVKTATSNHQVHPLSLQNSSCQSDMMMMVIEKLIQNLGSFSFIAQDQDHLCNQQCVGAARDNKPAPLQDDAGGKLTHLGMSSCNLQSRKDNLSASTSTRTTEEVYNDQRPPFPFHTCALEEGRRGRRRRWEMVIRDRGLSRSEIKMLQ